ncbi:hypothetical protein GW17_00008084 [Ensete ventricosum]|nr:hypothetical protein GW17_00008084 [Ensete ventricosum]
MSFRNLFLWIQGGLVGIWLSAGCQGRLNTWSRVGNNPLLQLRHHVILTACNRWKRKEKPSEVDTWLIEREEKRRCGGVPWFVNRKLLKSFIVWPPFSFSFFLEFASRVRVGNGDVAAFGLITISKEKQLRRDGSRERADVRRRPAGGQPRGQD